MPRRTMLKGIGAAGLAVGVTGWTATHAAARSTAPLDYAAFDAATEREFASMGLVGAALVSADRVTQEPWARGRHRK